MSVFHLKRHSLGLALAAATLASPTVHAAWFWPFSESTPATPAPATAGHAGVRDLAYGEALFDYFGERPLGALATLTTARSNNALPSDGDDARLLEADVALSLGMLADAERLFADSLPGHASPDDADRTWLTLAHTHLRRGSADEAHRILTQRLQPTQPVIVTEARLLDALALLQQGKTDDAGTTLAGVGQIDGLDAWTRFNLGAAFAQTQRGEQAVMLFRSVMNDPAHDADTELLRDRAAYACAMHYFRQKQWADARRYLNLVRLDSHVAEPALLAAGWASFNADDKVGALTPWLTLAERPGLSPAAEEALLTIPRVYEDTGALQDAMDGYRKADQQLQEEKRRIEDARKVILADDWIDRISPPPTVNDDAWDPAGAFAFKPDAASDYLYRHLASNEFMSAWQGYRDTQRLNLLVKRWQDKLPLYREVLDEQLKQLEDIASRAGKKVEMATVFRANVNERRNALASDADVILHSDDDRTTADDDQRRNLQRIADLQAQMAALPDSIYGEEKRRLARISGMLSWDLSAEAQKKRWALAKHQAKLDMVLDDFEKIFQRIQNGKKTQSDNVTANSQRLDAAIKRVDALREDCQRVLVKQRLTLRKMASEALDKQQVRLDQLRGYSLLSIARLQDRSYGSLPKSPRKETLPVPGQNGTAKAVATPSEDLPQSLILHHPPAPAEKAHSLMDAVKGWFE